MRKSKFTDKQIVEILKIIEDGAPVVETLREKGVSKDTYYKCAYSGLTGHPSRWYPATT